MVAMVMIWPCNRCDPVQDLWSVWFIVSMKKGYRCFGHAECDSHIQLREVQGSGNWSQIKKGWTTEYTWGQAQDLLLIPLIANSLKAGHRTKEQVRHRGRAEGREGGKWMKDAEGPCRHLGSQQAQTYLTTRVQYESGADFHLPQVTTGSEDTPQLDSGLKIILLFFFFLQMQF